MHVDGFRFDLASVLTRGEHGAPLPNPPVIWEIESDPVLAGTKLIAEAWDAAGLYQVGSFVGDAWREWNGKFRDDVRSFVKSDNGAVTALAKRLSGSPDIYGKDAREPEQSINFVTVHDGFTLNDLVSYNDKHNAANGEGNRDGSNDNLSWNCGVEGPTDDPAVEGLRNRQVKNFFTLLLTAVGAPLILMGDEVFREHILQAVADAPTPTKWVVVAAEPVTDIDVTAAEALSALDDDLQHAGIKLCFAEMKDPVKDRLKNYGLFSKLGSVLFFPTVGQAVSRYLEKYPVDWSDWEEASSGPATL
jgi:anti-anti-sigma regulatory factor